MKAEHRHELKTNELAEWIANFPQWTKDNLTAIIVVSAAVVVAAGGYIYYKYQRDVVSVQERIALTNLGFQVAQTKRRIVAATASGEEDISFMLLQLAGNLEDFAAGTKDPQRAGLALVEAAEALRTELHYRQETVGKQEAASQIQRAMRDYTGALEKVSSNPSLAASARFGLGLCEEELGNFDKAEQIYQQLAADTAYQATTAGVLAKQRLEIMGGYKQEVAFKPRPQVQRAPRPKGARLPIPPVPLRDEPPASTERPSIVPAPPGDAGGPGTKKAPDTSEPATSGGAAGANSPKP
jgi:tetratricopeptide (TPR) repeat protein